jgi:hypothetical protein
MGRGIVRRNRSTRIRVGEISTRRSAFSDSPNTAWISFGGTTLYGRNQAILESGVERIQESLLAVTSKHLILLRPSLSKLVREELGTESDHVAFGAILGRLLCIGELAELVCLTVNSRKLEAFVSGKRVLELNAHLAEVEAILRIRGTLSPREVQTLCFSKREWGSYVASVSILGHLAYLGKAVFIDKDLFAWPKEVDDALRERI